MIDEPHPTRPVPVEPHHLGVHAGFIDEYQPGWIKQALLANPFAAGPHHILALSFAGAKALLLEGDVVTAEKPPQRTAAGADSLRPYVGLLGVLLGSAMGALGSRVTSFGLADLRGGLSAGFDEGAWITTSFGIGQMLIGVASPYLGAVFGVRRILLLGIVLFFTASLLGPLSPNLPAFLTIRFLGGVGSGTFIPLTISFI